MRLRDLRPGMKVRVVSGPDKGNIGAVLDYYDEEHRFVYVSVRLDRGLSRRHYLLRELQPAEEVRSD